MLDTCPDCHQEVRGYAEWHSRYGLETTYWCGCAGSPRYEPPVGVRVVWPDPPPRGIRAVLD
jgi:hypothetical protein